jgi:hypothetical protein
MTKGFQTGPAVTLLLVSLAWTPPALGQAAGSLDSADAIEAAIASAGTTTAWLEFAADPDVWGDGEKWHMGSFQRGERRRGYTNGPVLVEIRTESGQPVRVHSQAGGAAGRGTRLEVPAQAAADYLLRLAAWMPESSAEEAIQAAVAARDAEVWPKLLEISKTRSRPADVRSAALFWVAQEAGEVAAADLEGIATASDEDADVQDAAVFAITQLPGSEGTDLLLRIARENRNPEIVESVYFWLGQSGDPRATDLFEEVLLR